MDQKKTFWIIAAVGLFLLAVIGTALIFYAPAKKQKPAKTQVVQQETSPDNLTAGWSTLPVDGNTAPVQLPQTTAPGFTNETQEMVVFADNAAIYDLSGGSSKEPASTTIDLNTFRQEMALQEFAQNTSAAQSQNPQNINITVNLPETNVTVTESEEKTITNDYYISVPVTAPAPAAKGTKTAAKDTKDAKAEEKNAAGQSVSAPVVSANTTTKSSRTTTVTTAKPVTQFWVQVIAYTNKKAAEAARSTLAENKIQADVFTYEDNNSRLFYRVRVGPYTTKSEAEYWKNKISAIKDFANAGSYITSTTTNQQ